MGNGAAMMNKGVNVIDIPYNINFCLPDGKEVSAGLWTFVPFQSGDEVGVAGIGDYIVTNIRHVIDLAPDGDHCFYISTSVFLR